ncbi:hypothetical protein AHMF7605_02110 [Adhaeribacter arboris]|uniref:Uncharacterized protein n=1 Tax=Adhaeribacter arboris TaxID=2072846 RepID=A0A2T2YA60_9BACT|nr:hypothetical protein [Adhaeribacter arboris]PSR52402.1 hypothetical protein AHMF7605_02110 [Adhaeribacter arboris]
MIEKGTKIIIKSIIASVGLLYLLPMLVVMLVSVFNDNMLTANQILENQLIEIKNNLGFLTIQAVVLIAAAILFGDLYENKIRKGNRFAVNTVTIISFWVLLFCSCSITAGVQKSLTYGQEGFKSAISAWIYGVPLFLMLCATNVLLLVFVMGKKLKITTANHT